MVYSRENRILEANTEGKCVVEMMATLMFEHRA